MRLRDTGTYMAIAVLLGLIAACPAAETGLPPPGEGQTPAQMKVVRLSVEEEHGHAETLRLSDVTMLAAKMLQSAGIAVAGPDDKESDGTLLISCHITAIQNAYVERKNVGYPGVPRHWRYSGAEVKGTFRLDVSGTALSGDFHGESKGAAAISETEYQASGEAPFFLALCQGFAPAFSKGLARTFGVDQLDPILALFHHPNPDARSSALTAIRGIKEALNNAAAVNAVVALARDDVQNRWAAIELLDQISGPKASEALVPAVSDNRNASILPSLLDLLCKFKPTGAREAVLAAFNDERNHAARPELSVPLRKLGWKPTTATEQAECLIGDGDWNGCAKIGPGAVDPLILVLKSKPYDGPSQRSAATALGKIEDARVAPALIEALNEGGDCNEVARALSESNDPQVIPALIVALDHGICCNELVDALGKSRSRSAIRSLEAAWLRWPGPIRRNIEKAISTIQKAE
jgi:HEAT repeat protein